LSEISGYQDLVAWRKAFQFGLQVYRVTADFPPDERFGLVSQLRRGAVALASNIAEGYGRGSQQDYVRFLRVTRGALYEMETQLLFALELSYISEEIYEETKSQLDECGRVLGGLLRSLE